MLTRCAIAALLALTVAVHAAEPPDNPELVNPLKAGAKVPDTTVYTPDGAPQSLRGLVARQPSILIFYRGGWCPYCTRHLSALAGIEQELEDLGYQIIAISADRPGKAAETIADSAFNYRLFSDASMETALAFGLAFRVDHDTVDLYKEYGIDLEDASGETHHLLPVPAVYIVGQDGRILFTHVDTDYTKRIDPDALVEAAEAAVP